jgi:hypothetical protein
MVIVVGFAAMHAARVVPSAAGEDADESSARSLVMQSKFRSVAAGVVAVAGLACAGVAVGDAVEWRVEDGGNGHWYAKELTQRTWYDQKAFAENLGGHLATITSAAENSLVWSIASPAYVCWLGGIAPNGQGCNPSSWTWVTGEAWTYAPWASPEPNYCDEIALTFRSGPQWNNYYPVHLDVAIIEWSADCNNNGVVDFGEIRNGFAVDANGNNIPDECECASDPTLAICCPEDIVKDGAVNAIDLAAILNTWGTDGGKFPRADVDGSGTVDGADLAAVLSQWGPCE